MTELAATAPRGRHARRDVHGVLLLDKPLGWSSNDALQKVKALYRATKAGHTGTLDPLATGLLPLCLGAAAKFAQSSLDADKRYRATLELGVRTSTGDLEGEVVETRPVEVDDAMVGAVLARFVGDLDQRPPMHSALKKDGRALYAYARAGIEVERATRRVHIHALAGVERHGAWLTIDVHCSKGTYVRTLAEDIGAALGCGAHLAALRRTACGPLDIAAAVTLDTLAAMDEAARDALLRAPDCLLAAWPAVDLPAGDAARLLCGQRLRLGLPDAAALRVYGPPPGGFLGTAHARAGELIPDRLLGPAEVAALEALGTRRRAAPFQDFTP